MDDDSNKCLLNMSLEIIASTQLRHTSCSAIVNRPEKAHRSVPSGLEFHQPTRQLHFSLANYNPAASFVPPHGSSQMPSPSSKSKSARRLPARMRTADAQEEPTGALLAMREAAVAKAKARPSAEGAAGSGSGGASAQARSGRDMDWTRSTDWERSAGTSGWRNWQWSSWTSSGHDWQWVRTVATGHVPGGIIHH